MYLFLLLYHNSYQDKCIHAKLLNDVNFSIINTIIHDFIQ